MKYGNYIVNSEGNTSVSKIINAVKVNSNVIEFGSSYGYILDYLKNEKQCNVYGYEIDEKAVKIANQNNVPTQCIDLDSVDNTFFNTLDKNIDYIICADVLEHLKNISNILKLTSLYLEKNSKCKLLVSFPNITYYGVLDQLLHGKFKYSKLGILDNTHLRFYDKHELEKLFNNHNLEIKSLQCIDFDPKESEFEVNLDENVVDILEKNNNENYLTYQYVIELQYSLKPSQTISTTTTKKSIKNILNDEKNTQITELNSIINKKNTQIIELNNTVNKKDTQIIELNILAKEQKVTIDLMQERIRDLSIRNRINKFLNYNLLKLSSLYNEQYYLETYFKSTKQNINPIKHYLNEGWKLGYNPSKSFNTNLYLELHKDVKDAGINPLLHYLRNGRREKRILSHTKKNNFIRVIYNNSPFLRMLWNKSKNIKHTAKKYLVTSSSKNLDALRYLSSRRNSYIDIFLTKDMNSIFTFPFIDISIVVYNNEQWVDGFFYSLESQQYPLDKINLYFIDHSLNDITYNKLTQVREKFKEQFSTFEIIRQENKGFGFGHDRAIQESNSEFILVSNIDLEFKKDAIINIVKSAINDKEGEYASWEFRQIPYEHPKYYDPVTLEVNWSSHACILIRREAYTEVGGYEPEIFMYAEDVELSYRFRSYGWHLKYCPDAIVTHYTYEEANEVKPLQFKGSTLGNGYIRFRYGNTNDKIAVLILYVALLFQKERFKGSRKSVLLNIAKLVKKYSYFSSFKIDNKKFYAPFREFDYEFIRDGAFHEVILPKEMPLISVIVRTYKGRDNYLRQCLMSIVNQTYKNIEVIVVEDGGENMKKIISSFATSITIRYYPLEKFGRSHIGNHGLSMASGKYCIFLDDDDLFFADHIETLFSALEKNKTASASYSLAFEVPTEVLNENKDYIEGSFLTQSLFYQDFDYDTLTDHNYFPIQTVLFKRELYIQRGGFDEKLTYLEDWNLWLRYAYGNSFIYSEKTTSLYRTPMNKKDEDSRHALLHEAYQIAKDSAFNSIKEKDIS